MSDKLINNVQEAMGACACVCQSNCMFINPEKPQRHTYISQYQDTHKHNVKTSVVVTVVSLKIPAFLDVMLCHWTSGPLHLKGLLSLKPGTTRPISQCHIPVGWNLHTC